MKPLLTNVVLLCVLLTACGGETDTATPALQAVRAVQADPVAALAKPPMTKYVPPPARQGSIPLGANLPLISDYSYTPVYADLVHQARRFGPPEHPWGGAADTVELGSDGWPVGDFGLMLLAQPGLPGIYKLSFTGQAEVALVASSDTSLANLRYDAAQNRTTADVLRGSAGENMVLTFSHTGPGIKALKVVRPGYDAQNPPLFTTEFLQHIGRFQTLRFMDWLRTNNSQVSTWADRSTESTHYAAASGVPWEHIIALANQTRKDIWINIPARADDDYVYQLATLLKSRLNAGSKIYVEYSNEVWNGSFSQFGINRDLAWQALQANAGAVLAYDGSTDLNILGMRRVAQRGKEISDIFRAVYGDAAMLTTVRPVLASQVVQPYVARVGLDFINAVYGPPARYFHALAGAPYFNLGPQQQTDGLTAAGVLQAMSDSIDALPEVNQFEKNMALARWYGLSFLAYEGGSDTFGPGSIAAKKAASLDPQMLALCQRYLRTWFGQGGGLFMWFTAGAGNWDTRYGTWELTPDLALGNTPKIQCIDSLRASPPAALQARNTVPGSFDALAFVGNPEPFSDASRTTLRYLHPGSYLDYLLLDPQGGSRVLIITAEAARPGNTVNVLLNQQTLAAGFELTALGWGKAADNRAIGLTLPPGFSTLRIQTQTENLGFSMSRLHIR